MHSRGGSRICNRGAPDAHVSAQFFVSVTLTFEVHSHNIGSNKHETVPFGHCG